MSGYKYYRKNSITVSTLCYAQGDNTTVFLIADSADVRQRGEFMAVSFITLLQHNCN